MADFYSCPCGFETPFSVVQSDPKGVCPACARPYDLPSGVDLHADTHVCQMQSIGNEHDPRLHFPTVSGEGPHRRRKTIRPKPPPVIPGYVVLEEIGRGGMGVVYRAKQVSLNRVVALKMILAGAQATPLERERFHKEAEAVAHVQHSGIVQIFEIGDHEGQPYLALEYVDGGSLADYIASSELLAVELAARLVAEIAVAVQYAHEFGILHRDLKPANVLLQGPRSDDRGSSDSGTGSGNRIRTTLPRVKVTDFGLAKRLDEHANCDMTKSGTVLGTPSYIAPEQASGKSRKLTPAADVYSLGAILYELLTGRPPFKGASPLETVLQVVNDDPMPPGRLRKKLPRDLETICLKCLNKDPNNRYHTAAALAEDLNCYLEGKSISARPLSPAARGMKWARRHPAATAFGSAALLSLLAVLVVLSVAYTQVRQAVQDKDSEAATARREKENADLERQRAEHKEEIASKLARVWAEALADVEKKRQLLVVQNDQNERNLFALQLARAASICERDPAQARKLLEEACPPHLRDFTWRHLLRLCQRDDQVYEQHGDMLLDLSVSPDGSLIATADAMGQVLLWCPVTKITYGVLKGHHGPVNSVVFAPDGCSIATTGDDGTVRLWDLPTGFLEKVRETAKLAPRVQSSGDSNALVNADQAPVFQAAMTLPAFGHRGRTVNFGPDCSTLAAGGSNVASVDGSGLPDGMVKVWDLTGRNVNHPLGAASGGALAFLRFADARGTAFSPVRLIRTITDHLRPVITVAISPDGTTLASGSEDRSVQLTSLIGGRSTLLPIHPAPVACVAFSPDSKTLATTYNGHDPIVILWELTARGPREDLRLNGHSKAIYSIAYSADGQTLATAGEEGDIRLWDAETGREKCRLTGHTKPIRGVAFTPNKKFVVSVSSDRTARVWQSSVRRSETFVLDAVDLSVITTAMTSGDCGLLVVGEKTGTVRAWRLDFLNGKQLGKPGKPILLQAVSSGVRPEIRTITVSEKGRFVAAGSDDGVLVWELVQTPTLFGGQWTAKAPLWLMRGKPVYALALAPDNCTMAVASNEGVFLWNLISNEQVSEMPIPASEGVRSLAFAPTLAGEVVPCLLAMGLGRTLKVLNLKNGLTLEKLESHNSPIETLAFSPGGHTLATGSLSGMIKLWSLTNTPTELSVASLTDSFGHAEPVSNLAFTHDGKTLLSVGMDRLLMTWDPVTGQERGSFPGHRDRPVLVAVSPHDSAILSLGRDGVLRKWRASANLALTEMAPPAVNQVSLSSK